MTYGKTNASAKQPVNQNYIVYDMNQILKPDSDYSWNHIAIRNEPYVFNPYCQCPRCLIQINQYSYQLYKTQQVVYMQRIHWQKAAARLSNLLYQKMF
jgi:hypothetical protein